MQTPGSRWISRNQSVLAASGRKEALAPARISTPDLMEESQAEQELQSFLEGYYGTPYETLARTQSLCAGTEELCKPG